jgi:hypothetical protein
VTYRNPSERFDDILSCFVRSPKAGAFMKSEIVELKMAFDKWRAMRKAQGLLSDGIHNEKCFQPAWKKPDPQFRKLDLCAKAECLGQKCELKTKLKLFSSGFEKTRLTRCETLISSV